MTAWGREHGYAEARRNMVDLIRRRGVRDERVLSAMADVPRHEFVPQHLAEIAYEDGPLPIGSGQTISQPYIVALMSGAAQIVSGDSVLEIGTGSGYSAAVLAAMGARVVSVERDAAMADAAAERLRILGYDRVAIHVGDGTVGWAKEAPFDSIIVTAGGPCVPEGLVKQLAIGGRLVIPVGPQMARQTLMRLTRTEHGPLEEETLGAVAFVPLIGRQGWPE